MTEVQTLAGMGFLVCSLRPHPVVVRAQRHASTKRHGAEHGTAARPPTNRLCTCCDGATLFCRQWDGSRSCEAAASRCSTIRPLLGRQARAPQHNAAGAAQPHRLPQPWRACRAAHVTAPGCRWAGRGRSWWPAPCSCCRRPPRGCWPGSRACRPAGAPSAEHANTRTVASAGTLAMVGVPLAEQSRGGRDPCRDAGRFVVRPGSWQARCPMRGARTAPLRDLTSQRGLASRTCGAVVRGATSLPPHLGEALQVGHGDGPVVLRVGVVLLRHLHALRAGKRYCRSSRSIIQRMGSGPVGRGCEAPNARLPLPMSLLLTCCAMEMSCMAFWNEARSRKPARWLLAKSHTCRATGVHVHALPFHVPLQVLLGRPQEKSTPLRCAPSSLTLASTSRGSPLFSKKTTASCARRKGSTRQGAR